MLRVTVLPQGDPSLQRVNRVFVHPNQAPLLPTVIVQNQVVPVQCDARVNEDCIAMSANYRTWLGLKEHDCVTVVRGQVSAELKEVELHVVLWSRVKTTVDENAMVAAIQSHLEGETMSIGQPFVLVFNGATFILHVSKAEPVGVLRATTAVALRAEPSRYLEFEATVRMPKWNLQEMGIGGLEDEFRSLFRRAFASRLIPQAHASRLGVKHTCGLLLYGPPGTGKTLIARQIGSLFTPVPPKIVNGPELLNKYVGQSEENLRGLFAAAEEEWAKRGEASRLHVIIFDEIDALCRTRGTSGGSTGVNDSLVNQLLTKLDGVNKVNNILVIGMTNRKDMLDPALLRPGRMEVQIEIGLPDTTGRQQILAIHTSRMSQHHYLAADVDLRHWAERTKNFTGAELEGLVRSALSHAMFSSLGDKSLSDFQAEAAMADLLVRKVDFEHALSEVIPAFGVDEQTLNDCVRGGCMDFNAEMHALRDWLKTMVDRITLSDVPLTTVLLEGALGSGKTTLAAECAMRAPFAKLLSPDVFVGASEGDVVSRLHRTFEDAYKAPGLSCIVLDGVERLIQYARLGSRYSMSIYQTLVTLLRKAPPVAHKVRARLLVIATTSDVEVLQLLDLPVLFNFVKPIPLVETQEEVATINTVYGGTLQAASVPLPVAIKPLIQHIKLKVVS